MRRFCCVLALLLLSACSALPAPQVPQFLDEQTGISLIVVDQPWVLARERRDVAAHARDYLTLVAAERDEMGRRELVLLVHRWSTIDPRFGSMPDAGPGNLLVIADGRDFRLTPLAAKLPREFASSERLRRPPVTRVDTVAYRADSALLRALAGSQRISALYDGPTATIGYQTWQDGRAALLRFLDATGAAR